MTNPPEEWRVISSHPRYEVSDSGQVRRGKRTLKGWDDGRGYLRVSLSSNGKETRRRIHQLVAEAFIGPRPPRHEVDHGDDDKRNNCVTNLEYVTQEENKRRMWATCPPKRARGETHYNSRLTDADVREIVRCSNAGRASYRELAKRFGVTKGRIGQIVRGHR